MFKLSNVVKKYDDKLILDDINLNISKGINIIYGPSGCGKSTLLNLLYGIDYDYDGLVSFNEIDVLKLNDRTLFMQYIFQDYMLHNEKTVYDNLKFSCFDVNYDKKINELCTRFNLVDLKNKKVKDISGGQKQRLAFARAMLNNPKVILMDEPTANLDDKNVDILSDIIKSLSQEGVIIIIATHDSRLKDFADRTYTFSDDNIIVSDINEINNNGSKFKESLTTIDKKVISFSVNSLKYKKKYLLKSVFIYVFIFTSFLLSFGTTISIYNSSEHLFYRNIPSDGILIDATELVNYNLTPDNLSITQDEMDKIENLPNISDVTYYNNNFSSSVDKSGFSIEEVISSSELEEKVTTPAITSAPQAIVFKFQTLDEPYDVMQQFNEDNIILKEGDFPTKDNELLVPDFILIYLDKHIGDTVTLNVKNGDDIKKTVDYIIAGSYKTNYLRGLKEFYPVYLANNVDVGFQKLDLSGYQDLYSDQFKTYEDYLDWVGSGYLTAYLTVVDANEIEQTTKELSEIFPKYKIISRYSIDTQYGGMFKVIKIIMFVILLLVILAALFLINVFNKITFKEEFKASAIDYSLGFSRYDLTIKYSIEAFLVHFAGYLLTTIGIMITGIILLRTFNIIFVLEIITNPYFILCTYFITLLILLVSYYSLLKKIKYKELAKYLKTL